MIHSGIYYRPGSLKARTVAAGRRALVAFCRENGIEYATLGKVIVAVDDAERPGLERLRRRGIDNDIAVELIGPERLAELEPHAVGVAALHVPSAAIVDFREVCQALVRSFEAAGGEFRPGRRVLAIEERNGAVVVQTQGGEMEARVAVNCAGLHSDRLAARSRGHDQVPFRIVPFRGEYRLLAGDRSDLVRSMIYPVPDPRFPFLGAHFTRTIDGHVHAGPNAVLALAREGYSWRVIDVADSWDLVRYRGFRRLVARHWRTGLQEMRQSLSRAAFLKALQRLVPEVSSVDLLPAPAGVRAQAVDVTGALVDDFVLEESGRVVHVLNAPSPAATACLEIGRLLAQRVVDRLG